MFAAMNLRDRLRSAPPELGEFLGVRSINITSLWDEGSA